MSLFVVPASFDAVTAAGSWPQTWEALLSTSPAPPPQRDLSDALHPVRRSATSPLHADTLTELARRAERWLAPRTVAVVASSQGDPKVLATATRPTFDDAPALARSMFSDPLVEAVRTEWPSVPVSGIAAACASGISAADHARSLILGGLADHCMVFAFDTLSVIGQAGFTLMRASSAAAAQPFAVGAEGTTVSEAAACLLVTSVPCAIELAGVGRHSDAGHLVAPSAEGLCWAVREALEMSNVRAQELAAVYWHGTGTNHNDAAEAEACKRLFGAAAPPGTSTKRVLGHSMGASSLVNLMAACSTLETGMVPPCVIGSAAKWPAMNLVTDMPARVGPGPVLVVAMGFGGINLAAVLRRSVTAR